MKQALIYSLKVWLTAVLLTLTVLGAIYCITMASSGYNVLVSVIAYIELILTDLTLTLPLFLLFWAFVHFISSTSLTPIVRRVVHSLAACALIGLLLVILRLLFNQQFLWWKQFLPNHFPIVIVTLISIWLYRLPILRREKSRSSV